MTTEDVLKALEPIAKGIGVAVSEVWKIFTRQYFIKGVNELFSGIVFLGGSYFTKYLYDTSLGFIALTIGMIFWGIFFLRSAIPYLFNPQYFAIEDIINKVKAVKNDSDDDY